MGPRAHLRHRHGRPSTPSWRLGGGRTSQVASAAGWRCAGSCSPSPTAAPRRAHQPPRRESVAWLERTLQTTRAPSSPSPTTATSWTTCWLDPRARPRGGHPWEGNYSSWLEQKQARLAGEEKADRSRQAALERELEWIRMSPRARQSKGKARINAYNDLVARRRRPSGGGQVRDHHPSGPASGPVVEAADVTKGFGDRLLIDDLSFSCRGRDRRGDRAERRRQDHAVSDDRRR